MSSVDLANLKKLRKLSDYRQKREHIFASPSALDWFIRMHKLQLVEAGALVLLTGQWRAHEERFDAVVLEVGSAAAARQSARGDSGANAASRPPAGTDRRTNFECSTA